MCLSLRKQYKSCVVNASCVCRRGSSLGVMVQCITHSSARKQFKSWSVNASCVRWQGSSLRVVVSMHHVFVNKEAVKEFWCHCIMCSSTREQFKSCGVDASCVFLTGEQFKSCGVNLSCVGQQGSSLKVIVSMHHVFGNKATVSKLWCQCF